MNTSTFIILFLLLCLSNSVDAKEVDYEALEPRINELVSKFNAAGLSIGIVSEQKLVYAKGFGLRDVEAQKPVTPDTVFPIGSITKSFTSSLLGIIESEELVDLSAQPAKYIKNFSFNSELMNQTVSVGDLLSHRSGLGNQGTSEIFFPENDVLKIVNRIKYLKPQAAPLNSFSYSNMAYTLAAVIFEHASSETWEKGIDTRLFQPLNMTRTFTSIEKMKKAGNYARPYGIFDNNIVQVKFERFNSIRPAGAIKSNVIDLSNWIKVWLNNGEFNQNKVIPEAFQLQATQIQNTKSDKYEPDAFLHGEGFGWRLRSSYGKLRVEHGGNTFGFSSTLAMFPFEDFGVVVLTNQDNSILPYIVLDMVVRHVFGMDEVVDYPINVATTYKPNLDTRPYNTKKPISQKLFEYTGTYYADGYGELTIIEANNRLYAKFPTLTFHLEHIENDSFYLEGTKSFDDVYNPEFTVSFESVKPGEISVFNLHSQREPIAFYRIEN